MATSSAATNEAHFPRAGLATDGWSTEDEATATCYCGAVQLAFPTKGEGLVGSFVCNCADCHKITASMFASNFIISDAFVKHLRGQSNLKEFGQSETTFRTGNKMTNYFCSTCGTLMYRIGSGFPGVKILRIGTVDDFSLHDGLLRPRQEWFIKRRNNWVHGVDGVRVEGIEKYEALPNFD